MPSLVSRTVLLGIDSSPPCTCIGFEESPLLCAASIRVALAAFEGPRGGVLGGPLVFSFCVRRTWCFSCRLFVVRREGARGRETPLGIQKEKNTAARKRHRRPIARKANRRIEKGPPPPPCFSFDSPSFFFLPLCVVFFDG